ncbi:MAG TPA: pyridoxamine 5'-phosphate oxidase family protein [Labilithrix sp.]|nr:pyridoxamine 5'-phosphate oxidase family protein [Labilithrix sp.]
MKRKLVEALRSFETLMVATNAPNGTIHARPMAVAEVDDGGDVWFVTEKESHKVDEIVADSTALATGQDARAYVSLSGRLDIIHDPRRLAALWKSSWKTWFPDGEDHTSMTLMRLRPEIGEYWLAGGLKGVRYLFEATRALLDGTAPREGEVEHAKVPM